MKIISKNALHARPIPKLLAVFNISFLLLFLFCALHAGLAPAQNKFRLFQSAIPILAAAMALIVGLFHLTKLQIRARGIFKSYRFTITIAFIFCFFIQLLVAKALESHNYGWDSDFIMNQAIHFAQHGNIAPGYAVTYFQNYTNNIGLLGALGFLFKIVHHFGSSDYLTAATYLNLVLMWVTQILIFLVAKMLYGRRIAAIALIFCFVFISLSMYVQIPYTDTLTLVFPIGLFYIALQIIKTKRTWVKIVLSSILGLVAICGYELKPTVIIALIAIAIAGVLWLIHATPRTRKGRILPLSIGCTVVCIVSLGCGILLFNKAMDTLHILPYPMSRAYAVSAPLTHFMAMGMTTQRFNSNVIYGGFDTEQANTMFSQPTEQAKSAYAIATIKTRLHSYGPVGYTKFLAYKANWILSDGTFYAYGEGSNQNVVFTHNDQLSRSIRSFMFIDGRWYILFGNILQVFWIAILFMISAQFFIVILNKPSASYIYTTIPRLMIAGILLFLLLFEGRSRYLFLYLPIFIITALYTLDWFQSPDLSNT